MGDPLRILEIDHGTPIELRVRVSLLFYRWGDSQSVYEWMDIGENYCHLFWIIINIQKVALPKSMEQPSQLILRMRTLQSSQNIISKGLLVGKIMKIPLISH